MSIFHWTTLTKIDGAAIGLAGHCLTRSGIGGLFAAGAEAEMVPFDILSHVRRSDDDSSKDSFRRHLSGETVIVLFFGFVLLRALRATPGGRSNRILTSGILIAFGKYSYGIYVIHGILRPMFSRMLDYNTLPGILRSPLAFQMLHYIVGIGVSFSGHPQLPVVREAVPRFETSF